MRSQVVGLRYFNVYGPGEAHKDEMASVAFKLFHQLRASGRLELFGASHGCDPGEQRRDRVVDSRLVSHRVSFLARAHGSIEAEARRLHGR